MSVVISVFIITFVVNIMLVSFGFNIDTQLDSFFETNSATGDISTVSGGLIGSINPQNFTGSSVNTGDPADTQFKLIDALGVARTGISLIASVLIAPLLMALQLSWPNFLVMLIAVPWTLAFWISLLLLIRGVAP